MATVIDSFVVTLGLDPTNFTKGQQQAYEDAKKLEGQQARIAKNVEYSADKAAGAIGGIKTQALEMLAVLTGGAGLVSFGVNLTHANASLGRLERNIGVSASTISKWQGVARIFGGDAQTMAASFTSISDAFAGWKIGAATPLIADLRAISTAGGKIIDVNAGVEQSYLDLAENLRNISARDPAQAGLLGRRIGLDPALVDAMISGKLPEFLELMKKLGVQTTADADAFGELEKRIGLMGLKSEQIGRQVLGGEHGMGAAIMELADILSMSPSEAWAYLNKPGRKTFGQNRGNGEGTGPGSNLVSSGTGTGAGTGAFASRIEKEQFIRSEAARRGINPNVAMDVAKSEGFFNFNSTIPGEQSYGAFQLHVTPGGRGNAVGDQFRKATGLDPADPANERASIAFALDNAKRNGWTDYHGAKNTGISQWQGIDRNGGGNTSTSEMHIENVYVTAPAGSDPKQFAGAFTDALKRHGMASQANAGAQ